MFERFSDDARKVVVRAQEEARALGHNYIGTEHLLLGVLDVGGTAARALGALGVTLAIARERVVEIVGRGGGVMDPRSPITPRAKKVLERSFKEARGRDRQTIVPEDILIALSSDHEGVAAQILLAAEATPVSIRSVLAGLPEEPVRPAKDVRLRPMTEEEFALYLDWVVDDYAAELERNGKATGEAARLASNESFTSLLPDGIRSPGQVLMAAEDDAGGRVGILWFGPSTDDPKMAWIYDITVDPDKRSQGWGRAVLDAFEEEARAHGFSRAGLNVYADNHVARRLYESMGYLETARQLHKGL